MISGRTQAQLFEQMKIALNQGMDYAQIANTDFRILEIAIHSYLANAYELAQELFKLNPSKEVFEYLSACFEELIKNCILQYHHLPSSLSKDQSIEKTQFITRLLQQHINLVESDTRHFLKPSDIHDSLIRHRQFLEVYNKILTRQTSNTHAILQSAIKQLPDIDDENYLQGKNLLLKGAHTARPSVCEKAVEHLTLAYNILQAQCSENFSEDTILKAWSAFHALKVAYHRYVCLLELNGEFAKAKEELTRLLEFNIAYVELVKPSVETNPMLVDILSKLEYMRTLHEIKREELVAQSNKPVLIKDVVKGLDATHHYRFTRLANNGDERGRLLQCGFISIGVPADSMSDFIESRSDDQLKRVAHLIVEQIFQEYYGHPAENRQYYVRMGNNSFRELSQLFSEYDQRVAEFNAFKSQNSDQHELWQFFKDECDKSIKAYERFLMQPTIIREFLLTDIKEGDIGMNTLLAWATLADRTLVVWKKDAASKTDLLIPFKNLAYYSMNDVEEPINIIHVAETHYERLQCHSKEPRDFRLEQTIATFSKPLAMIASQLSIWRQIRLETAEAKIEEKAPANYFSPG